MANIYFPNNSVLFTDFYSLFQEGVKDKPLGSKYVFEFSVILNIFP